MSILNHNVMEHNANSISTYNYNFFGFKYNTIIAVFRIFFWYLYNCKPLINFD